MRFPDIRNDKYRRKKESCFSGSIRKFRIVSEFGSTWIRLKPYDETEQRITINDRGQVWITRYERAPFPFDPDQILSREYIRLPEAPTKRIMEIAADCFSKYQYDRIWDTQYWYADLESTEGIQFQTDGSQDYEMNAGMFRLSETIRKELNKPDLLVVGGYVLGSEQTEEEEIPPRWWETISYDELIPKAEKGLGGDRDYRIELLKALEYQYYDLEESDRKKTKKLYQLMHKYVLSLEAEKPVRKSRNSFTWLDFANDMEGGGAL